MTKYKIEIGQVINNWTIVDSTIIRKKGYARVKVKCTCGTIKYIDAYSLFKGKSKRCSKCNKKSLENNPAWKGYKEIPGKVISRLVRHAKERNIKVNINIKDIWNKFIDQDKKCNLSNIEISFIDGTASVDRINSNSEYSINNIQIVHKDINIMKNAFEQTYFINICKLITEKNIYEENN